jgi:hypothetical protein
MMIIFVWNNFWIVFIDRIIDEVDFIELIFDWFWIVS